VPILILAKSAEKEDLDFIYCFRRNTC